MLPEAHGLSHSMPNGGAHGVSRMSRALCPARRLMPIVLERGGPIPGIIMLIIAGCGAWSLWGPIWSWPATFLLVRNPAWGPCAIFLCLSPLFHVALGPHLVVAGHLPAGARAPASPRPQRAGAPSCLAASAMLMMRTIMVGQWQQQCDWQVGVKA